MSSKAKDIKAKIRKSSTKEAKIYNGEKTVSSISDVGKTRQQGVKRMKLEHFLSYVQK